MSIDRTPGYARLAVYFAASATLHLTDKSGRRYAVTAHRKMRFWLVPNTDASANETPWLIDGLWSYQSSDKASKDGSGASSTTTCPGQQGPTC